MSYYFIKGATTNYGTSYRNRALLNRWQGKRANVESSSATIGWQNPSVSANITN